MPRKVPEPGLQDRTRFALARDELAELLVRARFHEDRDQGRCGAEEVQEAERALARRRVVERQAPEKYEHCREKVDAAEAHEPIEPPVFLAKIHVTKIFVREAFPTARPVVRETKAPREHDGEDRDQPYRVCWCGFVE